ncbi:hypothetical protein Prum_102880 [Phytohabitans rumicis]|uniref:NADH:quinone oxidoreductase/Mrp antiporter transmembrane domain-containing protein n=1 Tax=Phytohabitans rumicis TaxID=1076125 RepID=A0A6V8LQT0_9ACTN|nr:hypothetical protein Prum_102880 [Phytohabitans rumicis]
MLIAQQDYKRMLAYSSIEHMGLVALGTATGSRLAITAVLLHVLGHGLGKAVAFCGAGQLLHLSGSSRITAVRGLVARHPALAGAFGLALLALLGMPPFSLFASEIGIARAGLTSGTGWATAAAFILVLVAFAALTRNSAGILLGAPNPAPATDPPTPPAGHAWQRSPPCRRAGRRRGPRDQPRPAAGAVGHRRHDDRGRPLT